MITILGIPASFAAGASVFIKLLRDEPCQVRDQYFGVFKREFTRSLAAGSAVLLMIPLALYAASVYYRVSAGNPLLTTAAVVCLSIAIVWLIASFYLWVNLATVDLPVQGPSDNGLRDAFAEWRSGASTGASGIVIPKEAGPSSFAWTEAPAPERS